MRSLPALLLSVATALPAFAQGVVTPASLVSSAPDPDVFHVPAAPQPRGLDLVFLSDGYLSWDDFDRDIDLLLERMRQVEPWKSYARYNVYRILPREVGLCAVKTENERKPTLRCGPAEINLYLSRLALGGPGPGLGGPFKLVVLSRRDFQSWANVARLQDSGIFLSVPASPKDAPGIESLGWFFLHLLGHAFGLKDEEYFVIAKAHSAAHRPDGPNCAPDLETARKWWGDLFGKDPAVGYFSGCAGHKEYVKPTKSSLMDLNDLSQFVPEYGPVSERYLRKILAYCFSEKPHAARDDPGFFESFPELKDCLKP